MQAAIRAKRTFNLPSISLNPYVLWATGVFETKRNALDAAKGLSDRADLAEISEDSIEQHLEDLLTLLKMGICLAYSSWRRS